MGCCSMDKSSCICGDPGRQTCLPMHTAATRHVLRYRCILVPQLHIQLVLAAAKDLRGSVAKPY